MPTMKQNLLSNVNFPLYTVAVLSERHFLVAGGGGRSKTGIPNAIEIFELRNNGSSCEASSVVRFDTESEVIMNCSVYNTGKYWILFAGKNGDCQVYRLQHKIGDKNVFETFDVKDKVKFRKSRISASGGNESGLGNLDVIFSTLGFTLQLIETFQTDFSDDPFQKLVKYSAVKKLLVTAGSDGHMRLWKFPILNMVCDIDAHSDDVDYLDICPFGEKIVTVSRDGHAKVWQSSTGLLIAELECPVLSKCDFKYIFRACKFDPEQKKNLVIYAALNPLDRKKSPEKSYLGKWDVSNYSLQKLISTGSEILTAMAISAEGLFIGLGTQEGSVKIYIAFSLQQIYVANNSHGIFVTGLEFLQASAETRRITGGQEASLISISVDNQINVHHIPFRGSIGVLAISTFLIITLFLIYIIMDFFHF